MSEWVAGEIGPKCFCGQNTVVTKDDFGFGLLCFAHQREFAALFPLPDEKPEGWPFEGNRDKLTEVMMAAKEERIARGDPENIDPDALPEGDPRK